MAFTPDQFRLDYPQFVLLSDMQINLAYNLSKIVAPFIKNIVTTDAEMTELSELVVAHILTIQNVGGSSANSNGGAVGRVSSANSTSVSVSTEYNAPQSASYWIQSQYGALFYQIMLNNSGVNYIC